MPVCIGFEFKVGFLNKSLPATFWSRVHTVNVPQITLDYKLGFTLYIRRPIFGAALNDCEGCICTLGMPIYIDCQNTVCQK